MRLERLNAQLNSVALLNLHTYFTYLVFTSWLIYFLDVNRKDCAAFLNSLMNDCTCETWCICQVVKILNSDVHIWTDSPGNRYRVIQVFVLLYWHLVSIVDITTFYYLCTEPGGMHYLQTGDFAGAPEKLQSNMFAKKKSKARHIQKNVTNKQSNLLTHNTHEEQVFSTCVTAATTLTCWLVISVITLCNHSFSMERDRKKCLCLWEQASSRWCSLGVDNQLAFWAVGVTVSPAKSSGTCVQPSDAEVQQHMENGNIRQEGVRLSFSEFMF